MIYSYGGKTEKGRYLGDVYRLDPKEMTWFEVATPIGGKKPHERLFCCLCAIGSRVVMYGGRSEYRIPLDQLQAGAIQEGFFWSNEVYEFEFEEGKEKGNWLDLELSGMRPKPLLDAAMATVDEHRALLHGKDANEDGRCHLMNLFQDTWTIVDFNVKPSPRHAHTLCQIVTEELEDKSICLLVGGIMVDEAKSDYVYILDCDNSKAYQMDVDPEFGNVSDHTCHCVRNEDASADVIVCGGVESSFYTYVPIVSIIRLEGNNESYARIEREILASRGAPANL